MLDRLALPAVELPGPHDPLDSLVPHAFQLLVGQAREERHAPELVEIRHAPSFAGRIGNRT